MDTEASAELRLPAEVLARAVMSGREYAWRVADIPMVIEAAREAELASIGGQLQFLIPTGGTCECYWVEVDPSKQLEEGLEWPLVVAETHDIALREFAEIQEKYDFIEEGRRAFDEHLSSAERAGFSIEEMMYFVWYVSDQNSFERLTAS
jgi:hypothetical protein